MARPFTHREIANLLLVSKCWLLYRSDELNTEIAVHTSFIDLSGL